MNNAEIKEKVAAGVRRMKEVPDAFLLVEGIEWGAYEIVGIPVFYTPFVHNTTTDDAVPFIPLWKEPGSHVRDMRAFNKGFLRE